MTRNVIFKVKPKFKEVFKVLIILNLLLFPVHFIFFGSIYVLFIEFDVLFIFLIIVSGLTLFMLNFLGVLKPKIVFTQNNFIINLFMNYSSKNLGKNYKNTNYAYNDIEYFTINNNFEIYLKIKADLNMDFDYYLKNLNDSEIIKIKEIFDLNNVKQIDFNEFDFISVNKKEVFNEFNVNKDLNYNFIVAQGDFQKYIFENKYSLKISNNHSIFYLLFVYIGKSILFFRPLFVLILFLSISYLLFFLVMLAIIKFFVLPDDFFSEIIFLLPLIPALYFYIRFSKEIFVDTIKSLKNNDFMLFFEDYIYWQNWQPGRKRVDWRMVSKYEFIDLKNIESFSIKEDYLSLNYYGSGNFKYSIYNKDINKIRNYFMSRNISQV